MDTKKDITCLTALPLLTCTDGLVYLHHIKQTTQLSNEGIYFLFIILSNYAFYQDHQV